MTAQKLRELAKRTQPFLLIAALLVLAGQVAAAPCTDGTDCQCDCVVGPADPGTTGGLYKNASCESRVIPVDANNKLCEDFEAGTLYDCRGTGALGKTGGTCTYATANDDSCNCFGNFTAPLYGPWYDRQTSGVAQYRGTNSYWFRVYGPPGAGEFRGTDTSPYALGDACPYVGDPMPNGSICASFEWRADNAWGGDADAAVIDIIRNGQFDDDEASITPPTIPGGGSGVFDGRQVIGHRVPDGSIGVARGPGGFHGGKTFSPPLTSWGYTAAVAYASNTGSTGVFDNAWKDNETHGLGLGNVWDHTIGGNNFSCGGSIGAVCEPRQDADAKPYVLALWHQGEAACEAALAASGPNIGNFFCGGGLFTMTPPATGPNSFNRSTDWPFGTWACKQVQQTGLGTSNFTHRVWHNGKLIIELTNFNGTILTTTAVDRFVWNSYSNENQGGASGTTGVSYRYEDNVVMTGDAPVSCAQIGFSASGPGDDAGDLSFASGNENHPESGGTKQIGVTRSGGSDGQVRVTVSTTGGTADGLGIDFMGVSQELVWAAGETGTKFASLPITNDPKDEPDETVILGLGNVFGGATLIAPLTKTITIQDEDPAPSLFVSNSTATEGGTLIFLVTLSAESGKQIQATLQTADDTATSGSDYTAAGPTVMTFTPGVIALPFYVELLPDALDEANETLFLNASTLVNVGSGVLQGLGTINDNDPPPTVILGLIPSTFAEAGGVSTLTATLSAVSSMPVTVNLGFTGTAANLTEYTRSGTQIVIAAGSLSNTVQITGVSNLAQDPGKTVIVDILNVLNGTEAGVQRVTATRIDDDSPVSPGIGTSFSNGELRGNVEFH